MQITVPHKIYCNPEKVLFWRPTRPFSGHPPSVKTCVCPFKITPPCASKEGGAKTKSRRMQIVPGCGPKGGADQRGESVMVTGQANCPKVAIKSESNDTTMTFICLEYIRIPNSEALKSNSLWKRDRQHYMTHPTTAKGLLFCGKRAHWSQFYSSSLPFSSPPGSLAATVVNVGVFLLAQCSPILERCSQTSIIVTVVGGTCLFFL